MFKKKLGAILASFTKTQKELEQFIEVSDKEAMQIEARIKQLKADKATVSHEKTHAEVVLKRINELIQY